MKLIHNYIIVTFSCFLFCILTSLDGKANNKSDSPKYATISGSINGIPFTEDNVEVVVYKYFIGRYDLDAETYYCQPGSNAITVSCENELSYFRIVPKTQDSSALFACYLLVSPGDDVEFEISGKKINISGNGAAKMNCCLALNKYELRKDTSIVAIEYLKKDKERSISIVQSRDTINAYYQKYKNAYEYQTFLKNRFDTEIEKWKPLMSKDAYQLLLFDNENRKSSECYRIYNMYLNQGQYIPVARKKFYDDVISKIEFRLSNEFVTSRSMYIISNICNHEILRIISSKRNEDLKFSRVLRSMRDSYNSKLYEQLAVYAASINEIYDKKDLKASFDEVRRTLNDKEYRDKFSQYRHVIYKGLPAYNFSLIDTLGNKIRLSDFRGKIVVVDYWFTGCTSCVKLRIGMDSIFHKYKNDKRIVFVNINFDRDKEMWRKSLRGGMKYVVKDQIAGYVHNGSVCLTTAPQGPRHEALDYYGIIGAPVLHIIGADGNMIDASPAKPFQGMPENVIKFTDIIDRSLSLL